LRVFQLGDGEITCWHPVYAVLEMTLRQRWNQVDAIAKALLEKKTLTRNQVFEIYFAASKAKRIRPPALQRVKVAA
jgi:hypothetical protein